MGYGSALLCRALGPRRAGPTVVASAPAGLPELTDRGRRGSVVAALDEFALYDSRRRSLQLPVPSPAASPPPAPSVSPPQPPPPPPPPSDPGRPISIRVIPATPEVKPAPRTPCSPSGSGSSAGWGCAWSRRRRRRPWTAAAGDSAPDAVGYGSECLAGVVSAVLAVLVTAGVVYWLYASHDVFETRT